MSLNDKTMFTNKVTSVISVGHNWVQNGGPRHHEFFTHAWLL